MTGFPLEPLDLHVDAFIDGEWVDLGSADDPSVLGPSNRLVAEPIPISQGRQDESSRVSPGQFQVRLWNDDGLLTPSPASDWWREDGTGWDLNTLLRVRVGSTGILAVGEASQIVPSWPVGDIAAGAEPGVCFANVTASGIFRRLGQRKKPLRSSLFRCVTQPTNLPHVFDYIPMEDGQSSQQLASGLPGSTRSMVFSGELQLASDATLDGSEPLPTVAQGKEALWFVTVDGFNTSGVIEVFLRMPAEPDVLTTFRPLEVRTTGDLATLSVEVIQYAGVPKLRISSFDSAGVRTNQSTTSLVDSLVFFKPGWMQMRLELSESAGATTWNLNWYSVSQGVDPSAGFSDTWAGTFGQVTAVGGGAFAAPDGGIGVGHLILHDNIGAGWLVGPDVGRWNEEARSRISRLCFEEGVPRIFAGGNDLRSMKMGAQRALPLPDLLHECADADRGILCEQRDGLAVRYVHRAARYNKAPKLTLDASLSEIDNPLSPVRDDQAIRNDVTAERTKGGKARAVNETSMDRFGVYDEQLTLNVASETILRHVAGWQLHLGDDNGMRVSQLTLDLAKAPQKRAAWMSMRVGDVVRVTNLPTGMPSPLDLVLQGWSETPGPYEWIVTMNCTPADPWTVARWGVSRWDDGSVLGL